MDYLTMDVGGSAIKYAIINDDLNIKEKGQVPTPSDSLESFKHTVAMIYGKYIGLVDGIAMSLPGMINKHTNKVQIPGALTYNQNQDILQELRSVTTDRLTIENDAKCAALCEVNYGALKNTSVGAVIIIGTGIGGGITIGNEVFAGTHGFAGEFSYLSTDWSKTDGFDKKWANESSAFKLIKDIANAVGKAELNGPQAFEYCNQGNMDALTVLKRYTDIIAMGCYNLQAMVDPDKIAIGGGISKQPILLEYIQKSLDEIYAKMPMPIPQATIVPCAYYNDSNLIGALAHYKNVYNLH